MYVCARHEWSCMCVLDMNSHVRVCVLDMIGHVCVC